MHVLHARERFAWNGLRVGSIECRQPADCDEPPELRIC